MWARPIFTISLVLTMSKGRQLGVITLNWIHCFLDLASKIHVELIPVLVCHESSRNKGMNHIIGDGWRDLFEVVVTQARKPAFYRQPASR